MQQALPQSALLPTIIYTHSFCVGRCRGLPRSGISTANVQGSLRVTSESPCTAMQRANIQISLDHSKQMLEDSGMSQDLTFSTTF